MEPVVVARGDGPGAESLARARGRSIRAASRIPGLFVLAVVIGARVPAAGQDSPDTKTAADEKTRPSSIVAERSSRPTGSPSRSSDVATGPSRGPDRAVPHSRGPSPPDVATAPSPEDARRFRIRDEWGDCVVARLHGQQGGKTVLVQPDGQLGIPSTLVPTDKPFVPMTAEVLRERLERGPFSGFQVLTTPHYLIFYQSKRPFAQKSARLLEDLYRGLIDFFHRHDMPVHEAEFPLVAVIFATEKDFRAHHPVDPEVQAYYQTYTNRIFFYEESERDRTEPKVMALRKPQTVAHEGAHQILANIGVQPRLSDWPLWLTEGFAEFCATPKWTNKGVLSWDKLGWINPLHIVTLRELDDPLANRPRDNRARPKAPARPPRLVDSASLVTKEVLTPTDYAQAWALTHYLTQNRAPDFVRFLKSMSQMPPIERRSPEQNLAEFRRFFGEPARLDRKVEDYIRKQSQRKDFPDLPHYALIFEQPLGGGMRHRKAMISQSPQVIQKWLEQSIPPEGGVYSWQLVPFPTRFRAELAIEEWIRGN